MALPQPLAYIFEQLSGVFAPAGSNFSLTSLIAAFLIVWAVIALRRRGRKIELRVLIRALFPRRIFRSMSCAADLQYFLFNVLAFALLFGWTIVSWKWLSGAVFDGLTASFGATTPSALPPALTAALATLVLFLAYEFGYWVDHYLSHRIPALWELHKVHHTAEILTPLTVWRVHPLETVTFANILALSTATASGTMNWAFGATLSPFVVNGTNVLLVIFVHLTLHLQHTGVWIAFTGVAGRIFMSPAHHQIHHSMDPRHFNCNLGSCLSVWDTLFGTLYVPSRLQEKLRFGVAGEGAAAHLPSGFLVTPVIRSLGQLVPGEAAAPALASSPEAAPKP